MEETLTFKSDITDVIKYFGEPIEIGCPKNRCEILRYKNIQVHLYDGFLHHITKYEKDGIVRVSSYLDNGTIKREIFHQEDY